MALLLFERISQDEVLDDEDDDADDEEGDDDNDDDNKDIEVGDNDDDCICHQKLRL